MRRKLSKLSQKGAKVRETFEDTSCGTASKKVAKCMLRPGTFVLVWNPLKMPSKIQTEIDPEEN